MLSKIVDIKKKQRILGIPFFWDAPQKAILAWRRSFYLLQENAIGLQLAFQPPAFLLAHSEGLLSTLSWQKKHVLQLNDILFADCDNQLCLFFGL
jgi:hypothetical protein